MNRALLYGCYCSKKTVHGEAAGRGDPSSIKRSHGLPRYARNDGPRFVIAKPKAAAIHRRLTNSQGAGSGHK
jgi:hypothetical protein